MKCQFCRNRLHIPAEQESRNCSRCAEMVPKLENPVFLAWLLEVIDGRVAEVVDAHTERYSHDPGDYY